MLGTTGATGQDGPSMTSADYSYDSLVSPAIARCPPQRKERERRRVLVRAQEENGVEKRERKTPLEMDEVQWPEAG